MNSKSGPNAVYKQKTMTAQRLIKWVTYSSFRVEVPFYGENWSIKRKPFSSP